MIFGAVESNHQLKYIFQKALDYLNNHDNVRPDHLGIIGISISGATSQELATLDTRVRLILTELYFF